MNGPLTAEEIIKQEAIKRVGELDAALKKALTTYNELAGAIQKANSSVTANANTSAANTANKNTNALLKEKTRLLKAIETAQAKNNLVGSNASQILADQRVSLQANNKANRDAATISNQSVSAYKRESTQLNVLRERYKSLFLQKTLGIQLSKAQIAEMKRLEIQTKRLDVALKKTDAAAGQFNRSVGNYPKALQGAAGALRSFAGAFGFTSGIFLFASALKSAFNTIKQFDQGQADLAAILGRSKSEIGALTDQAKELGATTAFTATQVSELQLELAKLGFTDTQILKATQGVENLAIATGVDAASAAKLAGAAIRGFNLEAEEANRVAAVLAVSTTKSASSFSTLETALPKVSAIAKSFGFTIEDTTALLGGLQNAGFEASIAGTSLRQIFLQLADENGKLAQRLGGSAKSFDELIEQFKRLENEGIDLGEAFELTNARSVAAFKVFLSGAEDLRTLRDSITDVEGELTKLADTKLDSLTGDVTLLNSAWEGLIIAIEDGNGSYSKFIRNQTVGLTQFLAALTEIEQAQSSVFNLTGAEAGRVDTFANAFPVAKLINSITGIKTEYQELVDVQRKFDEGNKNIDSNGVLTLKLELQRLNKVLDENEDLSISQRELYREQSKVIEDAIITKKIERETLESTAIAYGFNEDELGKYADEIRLYTDGDLQDFIDKNIALKGSLEDVKNAMDEATDGRRTLSEIDADISNQKELLKEATAGEAGAILDLIDILKKERSAFERSNKTKRDQVVAIEGSIGAYEKLISKEKSAQTNEATTREQYQKSADKIREYEREIEKLTFSLDQFQSKKVKIEFEIPKSPLSTGTGDFALNPEETRKILDAHFKKAFDGLIIGETESGEDIKISFDVEIPKSQLDAMREDLEGIGEAGNKMAAQLKKAFEDSTTSAEEAKGIFGQVFESFGEYYGLDFSLFNDLIDKKSALEINYASTLKSVSNALFEEKQIGYEQDVKENQARLDAVLDDENSSDRRKEAARIEFDKRERALNIEKAEAQRDAALFSIAIDTAQAILKAVVASPTTGGLPFSAIAAAIGLVQAGVVKSQPLPEFFLGKGLDDNYEGVGSVNEKPGQREILIGSSGVPELLPKGKHYRHIKRNDIIIPSMSEFSKQISLPNSDVSRRLAQNIKTDTETRNNIINIQGGYDQKSMEQMMERVMGKWGNKPINVNSRVINKTSRTRYFN